MGMSAVIASSSTKPNLLILTDIGGDPDDQQAMVRLMVHSNEFELTGLIATSRMGHGRDTKPELIQEIVDAYGHAHANLSVHAKGFMPVEQMLNLIKSSNANAGVDQLDDLSEGAKHLVSVVDATSDQQPIHITIWGGATDLAQALHHVQLTRASDAVDAFVSRIRVYAIDDQDGTGAWINQHFPNLWYILNKDLSGVKQSASFRGMYQNDSRQQHHPNQGQRIAVTNSPEAWEALVKLPWVESHVHSHGKLGDLYPSKVWQGPTGAAFPHNGDGGVKEGDTPSWFYFLANGLSVPEEPGYGAAALHHRNRTASFFCRYRIIIRLRRTMLRWGRSGRWHVGARLINASLLHACNGSQRGVTPMRIIRRYAMGRVVCACRANPTRTSNLMVGVGQTRMGTRLIADGGFMPSHRRRGCCLSWVT